MHFPIAESNGEQIFLPAFFRNVCLLIQTFRTNRKPLHEFLLLDLITQHRFYELLRQFLFVGRRIDTHAVHWYIETMWVYHRQSLLFLQNITHKCDPG